MEKSDFDGLAWVQNGIWDPEPRWTIEPNEEAIKQTVELALSIPASPRNTINFLAEGAFNKVYVVTLAEKEVIARVTLPVDPKWKTLSEVATLAWVRENTSLPVPEVISYQSDRASAIRFEWITMSRMPGRSLRERWREVGFPAKEEIVRRLAVFCAETFRAQLCGIGNLFLGDTDQTSSMAEPVLDTLVQPGSSFHVGRVVSSEFIWENRIHADIPRGPFTSSREWLLARLELAEIECRRGLSRLQNKESSTPGQVGGLVVNQRGDELRVRSEKSKDESKEEREVGQADDEKDNEKDGEGDDNREDEKDDEEDDDDDLEDLTNTMDIISRLRRHLPDFMPPPTSDAEPSMVLHDDLSCSNILVDDNGNLTAVVDWECVSAVPLWAACEMPAFLQGKHRDKEPVESIYQHDEDGNVAELFWEHLDEYELTQLRRVFLGEMRKLQPEWIEVFESSERQKDFDVAVSCCSDPFMIRKLLNWLDNVESGVEGYEGLEEKIDDEWL